MSNIVNATSIQQGSITGNLISLTAAIPAACMQHCFKPGTDYGTKIGDAPTTVEKIVYVASGNGSVNGFHGLVNTAGSAASITMDLKKNGSSILSGAITITNATGNRVVVDGTVTSTSFVAGDVFSMLLTESSSTGMEGPYSWASITENSQPL